MTNPAMRDMAQNHLYAALCLIAMEFSQFEADAVRDENLKLSGALQPIDYRHMVRAI
jgi:glucose-6-phosphate 1-dehydrogenase